MTKGTEMTKTELETKYGKDNVWTKEELEQTFDNIQFIGDENKVGVTRKVDNKRGFLEFQDDPRLYFNFVDKYHKTEGAMSFAKKIEKVISKTIESKPGHIYFVHDRSIGFYAGKDDYQLEWKRETKISDFVKRLRKAADFLEKHKDKIAFAGLENVY